MRRTLLSTLLLSVAISAVAANPSSLKQIAVLDLPGKPGFDELAFVKGMLLITHGGAGTVDIFDPAKRRLIGHVKEMSSPRGIAVDDEAGLVYIANSGANNVVVLSSQDWQVRKTIAVSGAPESVLVLPAAHRLYVTIPDKQSVAVVDLTRGAQTDAVDVDGHPEYITSDPEHNHLYVTLQDRRKVAVLDTALRPVKQFDLNASEPTGILFSPKGDRLFVAVRYAVLALDPESGAELGRTPVSGGIDQLWFNDAANILYGVSNGSVFAIPTGGKFGPPDELAVDVKGHTLAVDASKNLIYVPGGREGRSKLLILRQLTPAQPAQNASLKK